MKRRTYIAPSGKGLINGIVVTAKVIEFDQESFYNPCTSCELRDSGICFDWLSKMSLPSRPACFGNDTENFSNKPIYYVKP